LIEDKNAIAETKTARVFSGIYRPDRKLWASMMASAQISCAIALTGAFLTDD
jgi:hypothetical protein